MDDMTMELVTEEKPEYKKGFKDGLDASKKEKKPIKIEVYEVGKGTTVCGQDYKCKKDYITSTCRYIKDTIYHCSRDGYLNDQNGVSWSCTPEWFKEYIQSNTEQAEEEKTRFVSGQFLQCKLSFDEFKEGEHYWFEYIGDDMYVGRSDNILNQKFHITPRQLYTLFSQQLEEVQGPPQEEKQVSLNYEPPFDENPSDEEIIEALIHHLNDQNGFLTAINCVSTKAILSWLKEQKERIPTESEPKTPDWVYGNWDDEYMINTVIGRYSLHAEVAKKHGDTHDYNLSKSMENWLRNVVKPLILEKQEEQEDDEGDFTIYHPQKNGEGNYKCIPFSFFGSLTSFSNDKDLMDFLNESFYDKEECERWCEMENKQELPECKHKIKKDSVIDYLCESSDDEKQKELPFVKDVVLGYPGHYFYDGERMHFCGNPAMEEKQKEQKPSANKKSEKPINPSSKFHPGDWVVYDGPLGHAILQVKNVVDGRYTFVDNESTLLVEDSDKFLRPLTPKDVEKKVEWSEEDEATIGTLINYFEGDALDCSTDEMIRRIRALRPSWKPSEEQMGALEHFIRCWGESGTMSPQNTILCAANSLLNDLKKL